MANQLLSPLELKNICLPNRIIRSATYEGFADKYGNPKVELGNLYKRLAQGGVGTIITGFVYVSKQGKAMHPGQCGIDEDNKIAEWEKIVRRIKQEKPETNLIMQLAHTGRQTLQKSTGLPVVGASSIKCSYFKQKVISLDEEGIQKIIEQFANGALRAKKAGFDGVQIHAAHGYLINQFLSPYTNNRKDRWSDKSLFLEEVIKAVQGSCGKDFPIFIKLSGEDDRGLKIEHTIDTIKRIEAFDIALIETTYGTMEYALNIIRGGCPINVVLEVNPLFNSIPKFLKSLWKKYFSKKYTKRFIPFKENYNLDVALEIKKHTSTPISVVGGIRSLKGMKNCISEHKLEAVSLCRPLICEPDIPNQIKAGTFKYSKCVNCNLCTIYCDSSNRLQCYNFKEKL